MSIANMCMLRWICGKAYGDKIRNERIKKYLKIAPVDDKIEERRLT